MRAKYIDEHTLDHAKAEMAFDGVIYKPVPEEVLEENGYYEVETSSPSTDPQTDYHFEFRYIEGNPITQEWYEVENDTDTKIADRKAQLAESDYKAIKYAEGWFTEEEYAPIKAEREQLREEIRELEGENA